MPKFLFDCGNTCIKFALDNETTGLVNHHFVEYETLNQFIIKLFNEHPVPTEIKIASVTKPERLYTLINQLKQHSDILPIVAHAQKEALGVTNLYDDPKTLGVDRWLALIATWDIYHQSSLVVDLGTALTIDYLSDTGNFEGGVILPGLKSLRDALLRDTAISEITDLPYTQELGRNTSFSISSGIHYAITGSILALNQLHPEVKIIILSGGRANWLKEILEPIIPHMIFYVHKDLVLEGLLRFQIGS